MTSLTLFTAVPNPGMRPDIMGDPGWFWPVAAGVIALVLVTGGGAWLVGVKHIVESFFAGLVVAIIAALVTLPVASTAAGETHEHQWEADTLRYLSSEYGIHANSDDLSALELGDTIVATYDGHQTAIKLARATGDKLALLTTGDRPLEPVTR